MEYFNLSKHYLGNLCKRNHEWQNSGKSLRYLSKKDCVECAILRAAQWQSTNREAYKKIHKKHRELNKETILAKTKAWQRLNKERLNLKLQAWNRSEEGKQKKKEYSSSERGKQKLKEYLASERGKAVKKKAWTKRRFKKKINHFYEVTASEIQQRFLDFDYCCAYCGKPATDLDHVIPLVKGGPNVLTNLIPSCRSCNSSKNDNDILLWYKHQPSYSRQRWKKILKVLGKTKNNLNQLPLF